MGNYTVSKKAFFFFLLIVGFHSLLGKILGFFLPVYFEGLGFSGVQTGIYFTFASISTVILSLPMGVSTDNKPIAYIFMLSFLLIGFGYLGLIISRSFFIICSFAFMGSFGTHFFSIASQSMFFKITGNKSPVQAGLYNLSNFFFMGTGMILGGVIIAGFSYKHAFILAFSVNVILIILSFFVPRTETVKITIEEYKKAIFRSDILFLVFIFFLSACHWGAENVAYAKFLKHNLFLSIRGTGIYIGLNLFCVGMGAYLGVILLQKKIIKKIQTLLIIGFSLAGVFHVLMCVNNVYLSFVFRMIHEIGDGFVFLAFFFGIAKIFHVNTIGGCAAFISLWMGIGSFSSSIIFGYIGDRFGNQWPLIISGIILALIPGLIHLRRRLVLD